MNTPDVQVLPDSQALHAEQSGYAGFVSRLVWLGLAVIGLAFPAYVLGWLAPQWPLERLPTWWGLSAQQVAQLAPPSGWPGADVFVRPDLLSLAGIAVLASAPALGLLGLVRPYWRRGDHLYVWICLALVALLVVAAVAVPRRGS
jgi:hypothetical protein